MPQWHEINEMKPHFEDLDSSLDDLPPILLPEYDDDGGARWKALWILKWKNWW